MSDRVALRPLSLRFGSNSAWIPSPSGRTNRRILDAIRNSFDGAQNVSIASPLSEGHLAARVFYLFDHGRELREIVQELEVPPGVVRDLWDEWLVDLGEGEMVRNKTATDERIRRAEEKELRELERRSDQEQRNFETTMATTAASIAGGNTK